MKTLSETILIRYFAVAMIVTCGVLFVLFLRDDNKVSTLAQQTCNTSRIRISLVERAWIELSAASNDIAKEDSIAAGAWKKVDIKRVQYWANIATAEQRRANVELKYSKIAATGYDLKDCGGGLPTPAPLGSSQ